MSEVTQILSAIRHGEPDAEQRLLSLVYDELRTLAAQKMVRESPGNTLQATALVHEAYLRLLDGDQLPQWDSRGHFFAAAAESMRRILVDRARQKKTVKHGGQLQRVELNDGGVAQEERPDELLALDEALALLEMHDPRAAALVKLRYFGGLSHQEAAEALGISRRAADHTWALARAWLFQQLNE